MSFLSPAAAAEMVTVDPTDIALLTCVLADHQRTAWTLTPGLTTAFDHDGPVMVQAHQLWLLLGEADPELVYDLDGAEDATAMNALLDAEFILRNAEDHGST
jgi:hypothetical protein